MNPPISPLRPILLNKEIVSALNTVASNISLVSGYMYVSKHRLVFIKAYNRHSNPLIMRRLNREP